MSTKSDTQGHCNDNAASVHSVRIEKSDDDVLRHSEQTNLARRQIGIAMALNWITGIAAFAAIIYAGITYLQWGDSARAFKADQRAWLGPQSSRLDQIESDPSLIVEFLNSGKTPAIHVESALSFMMADKPTSSAVLTAWPPPGPPPMRVAELEGNLKCCRSVAPQAKFDFLSNAWQAQKDPKYPELPALTDLIKGRLQNMRDGTSYLFIYAELRYYDHLTTVQHTTKWCAYVVNGARPADTPKWTLSSCPEFNDMD